MKGFGGKPQDWVIIFLVLRIRGKFNKKSMSNISFKKKINISYMQPFFFFLSQHILSMPHYNFKPLHFSVKVESMHSLSRC